jgi:hypothetical protein
LKSGKFQKSILEMVTLKLALKKTEKKATNH